MLKQLIQLFAEKFLQNKREAIQAWNYPTNTGTQLQLVAGKDYELFLPPTVLSRSSCAKILKGSALVLSRKGEATAKNAQELMRQTYLDGTRHSSLFKKASESNFHPRFSAPLQDVSFCLTKPNLTVGGASC